MRCIYFSEDKMCHINIMALECCRHRFQFYSMFCVTAWKLFWYWKLGLCLIFHTLLKDVQRNFTFGVSVVLQQGCLPYASLKECHDGIMYLLPESWLSTEPSAVFKRIKIFSLLIYYAINCQRRYSCFVIIAISFFNMHVFC